LSVRRNQAAPVRFFLSTRIPFSFLPSPPFPRSAPGLFPADRAQRFFFSFPFFPPGAPRKVPSRKDGTSTLFFPFPLPHPFFSSFLYASARGWLGSRATDLLFFSRRGRLWVTFLWMGSHGKFHPFSPFFPPLSSSRGASTFPGLVYDPRGPPFLPPPQASLARRELIQRSSPLFPPFLTSARKRLFPLLGLIKEQHCASSFLFFLREMGGVSPFTTIGFSSLFPST